MNSHTRREFLARSTAAGSLALLSNGCSEKTPVSASDSGAEIAIAKWGGDTKEPEALKEAAAKLTQTAVNGVGGLHRFIKKGATVWVKPNINFHRPPEFAANTNPDVVAAVVKLCYEAGAGKVKVGDHSGFGADVSYPMRRH